MFSTLKKAGLAAVLVAAAMSTAAPVSATWGVVRSGAGSSTSAWVGGLTGYHQLDGRGISAVGGIDNV